MSFLSSCKIHSMPKIKKFNWGPAGFIIVYHVILLVVLPFYFYSSFPSWGIWISAFVLLYLTGLSITGGFHRYYAHRTYKAHPIVEALILFFSTMAAQGSALRWSFDHRLHHAHVDTDEDPYSINKGFWYAHWLWILEKPAPIERKVVPDLFNNKWVLFQDRYYPFLMVATNALAFLFVGWLFNDYWGALWISTLLRMFALHHFTWFINSLAHTWGDKPFCQEQTAVNNYFLALLTFGEGYHNYHHVFANDYRNGIRWFHFDPTKWLIWTLHKLRLASNLKKVDAASIGKRMVIERKNLLLQHIKDCWNEKKEELSHQILEISETILNQMAQFSQLKQRYYALKENSSQKQLIRELHEEIKTLKREIKRNWREWSKLSKSILQPVPLNG